MYNVNLGSQIPLAHLYRSEPQSRLCNKLNKLTLATFDENGMFVYNLIGQFCLFVACNQHLECLLPNIFFPITYCLLHELMDNLLIGVSL